MAEKEFLVLVMCFSFWLPSTSRSSKCLFGCTCFFHMNRTVSANCNNLNLTAVPNNLPNSLVSLSLSYNSIAIIENEDFYNLTFILHLDLSYNKLGFLQPNSFIRCQELRTLDLSHNDLFLNSTSLPLDIFQPLKRLQSLSLHGNAYPFFDYPDYFLGKLHLLEILRMDGIPVNFGAEFSNIENLRELHLNGNDGICILGNVTQDTFRSLNTTTLAVLDVTHCHIETISKYAFSMLNHLSKLVLNEFKSGLSNLQNALTGLDMTKIAELYTSKIYKKPIPVTLNDEFRPLTNTSIQKLYITDSHLYDVRPEFIELLPRTIQELSLRDNILSKAKFLQKMSMLNSLIKVDVSFQRQYTMTDQITAPSDFGILQSHDDDVQLPPNLQIVVASHLKLGYGFVQGTGFKPNILRFLDLSCNELEVLGGEWVGLHNLQALNLSHNQFEVIDHRFFRDMYNLTHLFLGGNKLKDSLMSRLGNRTLESQVRLQHLDMSDNGIRDLPSGIFSNLHKLTVLHLNNNSLTDLAFLAGSLDRLIYLDLSFNQLSDINDKAKHALDAIGHVTVNLQGNPLKCTCGQLATLNWFVRTNVSFKGLPSLTCQSQNGSTVGLLTLLHEMQQVEIECWSIVIMISCIMTFLVLCFVLTIIALMYYKRWQIMYMYYSGKKHINPYGYEQLDQMYNAYLSYSDIARPVVFALVDDLEREGFTLFVPHVDIKPGEREYAAISTAIQNSSCLIAFLTKEYIQTAANLFEFNLAVYDGIRRRQQMIIPILLGNIPYSSLDKELVTFFKENPWYSFQNQQDMYEFTKTRIKQLTRNS